MGSDPTVGHELPDAPRDPRSMPDDLRATADRLIALDTTYGGDHVAALAVRAWRRGTDELAGRHWSEPAEREIFGALANLALVAAWSAYDAEDLPLARAMALEAVHASHLAGDRTMALFALDSLAMQAVRAGRAGEARRLADEVADHTTSPRTRAVAHIRRAGAASLAGDRPGTITELHQARSLIADGDHPRDPPWTWWVDEAQISWHEAAAFMRLGEPRRAMEHFRDARAGWAPHARRSRYACLVHLLAAEVAASDWADAEEHLTTIARDMGNYSSARVAADLRRAARAILRAAPSSTLTDTAAALLTAPIGQRPS